MSFRTSNIIWSGYGGGVNTYQLLATNGLKNAIKCFSDNNPLKYDTVLYGIKVCSCETAFKDYRDEVVLISCGEGDEIIQQLRKYKVPSSKIYIPDISAIDETDPAFIEQHIALFDDLYKSFGDDKSRTVMTGVLNYKMTHDMRYIEKIADNATDQYFDKDIIKYDENDVFLDCGAYIGDTAEEYIRHNAGKYKKIICLEADTDNCSIIAGKSELLKIELVPLACWSESAVLAFDKIGSGSGTILADGQPKTKTVTVKADTIDNIVRGERISFIKMDIEGAEYDALIGARHVIERDEPVLMISAYHKQDDLLRLPALIRSINYNYTFYLRHYRSMSIQETVLYAIVE